jgi:hypothetical protein
MQSVILAVLFPTQKIFILEKRKEHVRNHGLKIWHTTIQSMQKLLKNIKEKISLKIKEKIESDGYFQLIMENIDATILFLETNFINVSGYQGPFISTKKLSIMFQDFALQISKNNQEKLNLDEGKVVLKQGKQFNFKVDYLNFKQEISKETEIQTDSIEEKIISQNKNFIQSEEEKLIQKEESNSDDSEIKFIIENSSILFSAEGSHSEIRKVIFGEEFPKETVIQYLIEIKLHVHEDIGSTEEISSLKSKKRKSKSDGFSSSLVGSIDYSVQSKEIISNAVTHMVSPLLSTGKVHVWNQGKDGTATLHILVQKDVFDAMTRKKNSKGNMGGFANPYTRIRQLPYEADVRKLIKNGIVEVVGLDNFDHDSLKITTIPMKIYMSKELMKIEDEKLFVLVGDSACGLIFVEGANNAIHTGAFYGESLFNFYLEEDLTPESLKSYTFKTVPDQLKESVDKIHKRYKEAEKRIEFKEKAIRSGENIAKKINISSSKISSSSSYSRDEEVVLGDVPSDSIYFNDFKDLENAVDSLESDDVFGSLIHLFDTFVNDIEEEINYLHQPTRKNIDSHQVQKLMKETKNLIEYILKNKTDKQKCLEFVKTYHKDVYDSTLKESSVLIFFETHKKTNLTEKMETITKKLTQILDK